MMKVLCVGAGGFVGSTLRYGLGLLVLRLSERPSFPVGTLSVNLIGCFIIGFLGQLGEHSQVFGSNLRLLLFVGLLGGFTTFSSFGYETVVLLRETRLAAAFANIAANLLGGCLLVLVGMWASRLMRFG